jgi:hypothetical protein
MTGFNIEATVRMHNKNRTTTRRVDLKDVSLIAGNGYRGASASIYSKDIIRYDVTLDLIDGGNSQLAIFEVYREDNYECLSIQNLTNIDHWLIDHRTEDGDEENYTFSYNDVSEKWEMTCHLIPQEED